MTNYKIKCRSCNIAVINGHVCHEQGCNGVAIYQDGDRPYCQYQVWSVECWGNARDGFEMNDRAKCAKIMVPLDATNEETIRILKREGLLNKRIHFKSISIHGDDRLLMVDAAKTGEQLYQLELI